jgi:hypothetical protein
VHGRIIAQNKTPIDDAKVSIVSTLFRDSQSVDVDPSSGRFDIASIPPGGYRVVLFARGYPNRNLATIRLSPDESLELGELVQPAPGRLHARILGPDGAPARDVRASFEPVRDGRSNAQVEAIGVGSVDSAALDAGAYTLLVRATGAAPARVAFDVRPGDVTSIDVELVGGTERKLRFELPEGDATSTWVSFLVRDASGALVLQDDCDNVRLEKTPSSLITLAVGDYSVEAFADGHLRASARFRVLAGEATGDPIALRLEKRD